MWIRALENNIPVKKICTNHPGVDNFNVRRDVWGDCAVIDLYEEQFNYMMEYNNALYVTIDPSQIQGYISSPSFYVDPQLWQR